MHAKIQGGKAKVQWPEGVDEFFRGVEGHALVVTAVVAEGLLQWTVRGGSFGGDLR